MVPLNAILKIFPRVISVELQSKRLSFIYLHLLLWISLSNLDPINIPFGIIGIG
jgi:hypothetical protein